MRLLLLALMLFLIPVTPVEAQSEKEFNGVKVSWYGWETCRNKKLCRTASGQIFEPEKFTAACWSDFKMGTKFKVSYGDRNIVVTCNDRGGFKKLGRMLDLSSGSFKQLAPLSRGILITDVEVIR